MTSSLELKLEDSLYPKQYEAIFCPERWAIIEASTKSGKTMGCLTWLLTQATDKPGTYWWIAPVYSQTSIAFNRLLDGLKRTAARAVQSANESTHTITLVNGSRIEFKSGEKPDNLYGEDVEAAVIDEASRMREESYYAIRSTLSATEGKMRIIGNVSGRANWMYKLARLAESGRENWHYARLTYQDAIVGGVLTQAEVDDARQTLPDFVFNELYEALASDNGSNPFRMDSIERCIAPLSDLEPRCWGWDLAKTSDFTVGIALDENNQVCRFERFQMTWQNTEERIAELVSGDPAMIDSTGVGDPIVEGLESKCWQVSGFHFSATRKQQIIERLIMAIEKGEIKFPEGQIVSELMAFGYEQLRTGIRYEAITGHDDAVMALALALHQSHEMPGQGIWFA